MAIITFLRKRRVDRLYRRINRLQAQARYLQDLVDYEAFY